MVRRPAVNLTHSCGAARGKCGRFAPGRFWYIDRDRHLGLARSFSDTTATYSCPVMERQRASAVDLHPYLSSLGVTIYNSQAMQSPMMARLLATPMALAASMRFSGHRSPYRSRSSAVLILWQAAIASTVRSLERAAGVASHRKLNSLLRSINCRPAC